MGAQVVIDIEDQRLARLVGTRLRPRGVPVTVVAPGTDVTDAVTTDIPTVMVVSGDAPAPAADGHQPAGRASRLAPGACHGGVEVVVVGDDPERASRLAASPGAVIDLSDPDGLATVLLERADAAIAVDLAGASGTGSEHRVLQAAEAHRRRPRVNDGALAVIDVAERRRLSDRLGRDAFHDLIGQVESHLAALVPPSTTLGRDEEGRILAALTGVSSEAAAAVLERAARSLAGAFFAVGEEATQVTPTVGYVPLDSGRTAAELRDRARRAAAANACLLDLVPTPWDPSLETEEGRRARGRRRTRLQRTGAALAGRTVAGQLVLTTLAALGLPYLALMGLAGAGIHPAGPLFVVLVASMVFTSYLVVTEHLYALDSLGPRGGPPPWRDGERYAPATAVIAAYLPNESATVASTLRAFLDLDYPGGLQVILAYNTPQDLPVEETLRALASHDPRLVLLRVPDSSSKAQNVNAALELATGEFVGIFDADHHPAPDAFHRAAQWIDAGYDVVQGHCAVRNGGVSHLARVVAVEFESMYAVSHPGRARMTGFGIFGGSNGYWRTSRLRSVRMRPAMLTEDIDATVRALLDGAQIASDPGLLSWELAPTTWAPLIRQRLRWAQGWSQVSWRYLVPALRSPKLSRQQKAGFFYLMGWRELYPWISMAIFPVMAFVLLHPTRSVHLRWDTMYGYAALLTLAVGPLQAFIAYALAARSLRAHGRWFLAYCLVNFGYNEFKNAIARVAQLKELLGEHVWHITPRQAGVPGAAPPPETEAVAA